MHHAQLSVKPVDIILDVSLESFEIQSVRVQRV